MIRIRLQYRGKEITLFSYFILQYLNKLGAYNHSTNIEHFYNRKAFTFCRFIKTLN